MREHGKLKFEPVYLGLSAAIATLLIYEPALHSFVYFTHFDEFIRLFSLAALTACTITSIAYAVIARTATHDSPATSPVFFFLLGFSTLAGSIGFLLLVEFLGAPALHIAIGACAGVSSALVLISWGHAYTGCSIQQALVHIALSCIVGALLMNTMGTLPFPVTAVLFVTLSAASAIIPAVRNRRSRAAHNAEREPIARATTVGRMMGNLFEPLAGLFLFSLVFATLGDHHVYLFYLSFLLGTLLSGLCIIPLLMVNSRRPILSLVYQVVLPLLGLFMLVIILVVPDGPSGMVARNGFMLFFAFASMLFCASIVGFSTADEFDPSLILGSAVATFAAGGLLGTVLASTWGRSQFVIGIFLALTCIYVITLAIRPSLMAWMGRDTNLFGTSLREERGQRGEREPGIDNDVMAAYGLTEREREILDHIAAGHSSSYIARTLFISESTVRGHVHHLYQKFGVSTREDMIRLALQRPLDS